MASNIDYLSIDENYPLAGVDNPSQGLRDNYKVIKDSLQAAKNEIEELQDNTAKTNAPNDFNGNEINDANLKAVTGATYIAPATITTNQNVTFQNGHYQVFRVNGDVTLSLIDWPAGNRFAMMRLALLSEGTSRTVSFAVAGYNVLYSPGFPTPLIISSVTRPKIIELWSYNGTDVFAKYVGEFNTTPLPSDIPIDISDLTDENNLLFSKNYNDLTNKPALKTVATTGSYTDLLNKPVIPLTTDDLPQGTTNFYLTQATLDNLLGDYQRTTSDIDNDTVTDSIQVLATPSSTTSPTAVMTLQSPSLITHFVKGQRLKIYGAQSDQTNITATGSISSLVKNGFIGITGGTVFSYKVAQFEFSTGKVSASTANIDVSGVVPTDFNTSNNVTVNISRTSATYGILLYRKITGAVTTSGYNLIAVLGPKDFETYTSISYVDYYNFDLNTWSNKNIVRNDYESTTGTIHFPITAPDATRKGWVDATVDSVDAATGRVTLTASFYCESSVIISHNDTVNIQNSINSRVAQNLNSLRLGDKAYIVSSINVPSGFTIFGRSRRSQVKKLSWSSLTDSSNKIFKTTTTINSVISLTNFKVDGNMQNQALVSESADNYANYAIDIQGTDLTFDSLIVSNIIGGGIYSTSPVNLVVSNCQIEDSGMSDRYNASPLVADGGNQLLITNNVFRNFADAVDISVADTGVLNGNIISNCGSGVLIFGAKNLVSSPNVLLGPAGEFLPSPDILDSQYDSVNIALEPDANFLSDSYRYQENGLNFDLTKNRAFTSFKLNKLRKTSNVEELYGEVLLSRTATIVSYSDVNTTATGNINSYSFVVASAANIVPGLLISGTGIGAGTYVVEVSSTTIALSKKLTATINNSAVTFKANVLGARAIAIDSVAGINTSASYASGTGLSGSATVLGINGNLIYLDQGLTAGVSAGNTISIATSPISAILNTDLANGEFRFSISKANVNTLVTSYSYSTLKVSEPNHIGLVYRAFLTEYFPSGDVKTANLLTTGINISYYTVKLDNAQNISVDSRVRFLNHGGTPSLDEAIGRVISINPITKEYTIEYDFNISAVGSIVTEGANKTVITVENTFVLAKGRVI